MSDADVFAAQDTAHDLCEVNCGQLRQGVECPVSVGKRFRKKLLICGCCGNYFNTWPTYVDQDQDAGYGICRGCQDWQDELEAQRVESAWKTVIDGKIKPTTRQKIIDQFGATYESRRTFVLLALDKGWLKWSIGSKS